MNSKIRNLRNQYFSGCKNVGFEEGYVTYDKYKNYLITYRIDNLVETERIN